MPVPRRNLIKLGGALVVALCVALSAPQLQAQSGKVEVHWLGQATFKITTPGGKVIVTDPFLTGIPRRPPSTRKAQLAPRSISCIWRTEVRLVKKPIEFYSA